MHRLRQRREGEGVFRAVVLVISHQASVISEQSLVTDGFPCQSHRTKNDRRQR